MTDFPTKVCFLRSGTIAASFTTLSQASKSGFNIYVLNKWNKNIVSDNPTLTLVCH